jgi:hypothetical protein
MNLYRYFNATMIPKLNGCFHAVQLGGKNTTLTPSFSNSPKWLGALSMISNTSLPVLALTDGKNTVLIHFQHVSTSIHE